MPIYCWPIIRHVAGRHVVQQAHHYHRVLHHVSKITRHPVFTTNIMCRVLPAVLAGGLGGSIPALPPGPPGAPPAYVQPEKSFQPATAPFAFGAGGTGISWFPWPHEPPSNVHKWTDEPFISINEPAPNGDPLPPPIVTSPPDSNPPSTSVGEPSSALLMLAALAGTLLLRLRPGSAASMRRTRSAWC
jgi:hypothetical protein